MKTKTEIKSRIYRLTRGMAPLSFMLPSKSSKRRPLLYFDEETGENREIRYATNQMSPFKDEQDGFYKDMAQKMFQLALELTEHGKKIKLEYDDIKIEKRIDDKSFKELEEFVKMV